MTDPYKHKRWHTASTTTYLSFVCNKETTFATLENTALDWKKVTCPACIALKDPRKGRRPKREAMASRLIEELSIAGVRFSLREMDTQKAVIVRVLQEAGV